MFLTWAGLLWGGVAAAEPMHVRAVASPPETLQKLTGKRAIRLYWDAGWPESLGPATVELKTSSGWKAIGSGVEPGWLSKPLPRESQLRVIQGGQALQDGSKKIGNLILGSMVIHLNHLCIAQQNG